jgi:hypothetical protein
MKAISAISWMIVLAVGPVLVALWVWDQVAPATHDSWKRRVNRRNH